MDDEIKKLNLLSVVGFNGSVPRGLRVHPDRQNLLFSLGSTVVIENICSHQQNFLHGHSNTVVCITVDKSGKFIASGQMTHMGFKADIIVWNYPAGTEYARFSLHKVEVKSMAFSCNSKYLFSLGGQDDECVIVWSIEKREPICGSPAQHLKSGVANCIQAFHLNDSMFVTAGDNTIRVWKGEIENRLLSPTDVTIGNIKRTVNCIVISDLDELLYCGTNGGDILVISLQNYLLQTYGPIKDRFSLGVTAICLNSNKIIIGSGEGIIGQLEVVIEKKGVRKISTLVRNNTKSAQVLGKVTSLTTRGTGLQIFIGTDRSQMYSFDHHTFKTDLLLSCHPYAVNDIRFPNKCSDLFVTCSYENIRVFHSSTQRELLRIEEANLICYSIAIFADGSGIVSGWSDSKIRAYYPYSGSPMFTIENAHKKGVTALVILSKTQRIISGGGEGQVRVWDFRELKPVKSIKGFMSNTLTRNKSIEKKYVTELISVMKEHTNSITCMLVNRNETECVSSSSDGTCIVWNIVNFARKQIFFSNTLFRCACYDHEEVQLITSGTNRQVSYWELYDGQNIRNLTASLSGAINGMDISPDGRSFVTGGDDKMIKLWGYNEGETSHVGLLHSSTITQVRICPNKKVIVTGGTDGAIYIWQYPE